MRNMAEIVKKYADLDITEDDLYGRNATPVLRLMTSVLDKIDSTERSLLRSAARLREVAEKIEMNVHAAPGDHIRSLNSLGEVSGGDAGRTDALIAEREVLIDELKRLVWLHREAQKEEVKPAIGVIPDGTTVLVTPTAADGTTDMPFVATVQGAFQADELSDKVAWYYVKDATGQELEVLPEILTVIQEIKVKGFSV